MGRFEKLNKKQEVVIGDEKFELRPLDSEYFEKFIKLKSSTEEEISKEIICATLKQSDDTITMEDVKELPFLKLLEIMKIINEINGLS